MLFTIFLLKFFCEITIVINFILLSLKLLILQIIGFLYLLLRILLLGLERIFLKKNEEDNSTAVSSLFFLIAALALSPGLFWVDTWSFSPKYLLFAILSSSFYAVGFFAYVRAISIGEISLIASLYNSSIFWLMILGLLFLGDHVTIVRILGGVIMFLGVILLYPGSLKTKLMELKNSRASLLMIFGSVFIALGRTIDSYVISEFIDPILYSFLINLFIGILLLLALLIKGDRWALASLNKKPLLAAGIVNGWSYLLLLLAIGILEVTVAEPASLLSVFVTAILAKYYLGENIEQRMVGIVTMIIGAIILTLSIP